MEGIYYSAVAQSAEQVAVDEVAKRLSANSVCSADTHGKEVTLAKKEKRKYSDRRQYLIRAVHKRRKKIREMAIQYKGGKCERCGYDRCIDALEFHHKDPSEKDFNISSKGYTRSWKRVQAEVDKCVMLCANCHREVHAKLAARISNDAVKSGLSQGNRNVETTAILS